VTAPNPEERISDAERDHQIARLRQGTADGRLTLDEFTERVGEVYAATTRGELERVAADLPAVRAEVMLPERRWVVGVLSGARQSGRWRPARPTRALAVLGSVQVDLSDAELGVEVDLVATAVLGGIEVLVPEGVHVDLGGFALLGGRDYKVRETALRPGAAIVRVRARAVMGGVTVRTKPFTGRR
jgi:hypothetical protein